MEYIVDSNLQRLCAQVEILCNSVEEMLASPTLADRTGLQAKLIVTREILQDVYKEVGNMHKLTELVYNQENKVWE